MKKLTRYLQKQALQYSDEKYSSAAYLSPRANHEPQQHVKHHSKATPTNDTKSPTAIRQHAVMPPNTRKASDRGPSIPNRISSNIQRVQYASENILQSYELFIPPDPTDPPTPPPYSEKDSAPPKLWIIFIHGGYFRDPSILASSFHATLSPLTDPETPEPAILEMQRHIAGYVSINYRLAPHEAHPQDPRTTPGYELREARWPAMQGDVLAALKHFQTKHPEVGVAGRERYLLVGHSVGATLALNALLHMQDKEWRGEVAPPVGVVGVAGIYDFLKLHERFPGYKGMTRNAIDEEDWEDVSVARRNREDIEKAWAWPGEAENGKQRRWLRLAHSREDMLVDWGQIEAMAAVFDGEGEGEGVLRVKRDVVEIKGKHNACWEDGRELARVIREQVEDVTRAES